MHPPYYRGCWHGVSRCFLCRYSHLFFPTDRTLHPEGLNIHAVLLRQAFAHCAKFPTAASRRSMGRVSVPLWLFYLSVQLHVIDLVGRYLTNYLICRTLIQRRSKRTFQYILMRYLYCHSVLARFSSSYPQPKGRLDTCYSPVHH